MAFGGDDAKLADLHRQLEASEKAKATLATENARLDRARRKAEIDRIAAQKASLTVERKLVTARPPQSPATAAGDSAATAAINLTKIDDDDELSTDDAVAELRRVTSDASVDDSGTLYGLPDLDDREHGDGCDGTTSTQLKDNLDSTRPR